MVGYPIELFKEAYKRKCIEFNLGILIDEKEYEENEKAYSVLLKNIGRIFIDLEEECEFVWSEKYKVEMLKIVKCIFEDFQEKDWAYCQVTKFTTFHAKLLPLFCLQKPLEPLNNYDVPIFVKPFSSEGIKDFGILRIAEQIDGIKCISKLAMTTDINIVKNVIQYLQELGYIEIIDIFQFANSYVISNIRPLIESEEMQRECMEYIDAKGDVGYPVRLYEELAKANSVGDFVLTHEKLNINIKELVSYGIINKIIRRIHYYVYVKDGPEREAFAKELIKASNINITHDLKIEKIKEMLNGTTCLDSMSLILKLCPQSIKNLGIKNGVVIFPK